MYSKKVNPTTIARSLCRVSNREQWREGDVVVLLKLLQAGCNSGKFVYNGRTLVPMDLTVDQEQGALAQEFAVVFKYPIGYWAGSFQVGEALHRTIDHNSLVFCKVPPSTIEHVMRQRQGIIDKVMSDRAAVTLDDRLVTFVDSRNNMFGLICEFGMDASVSDLNQHLRECNQQLKRSEKGFHIQFPRFRVNLRGTQRHSLVTKDALVSSLEVSSVSEYREAIKKLTERGVSPDRVGFVDCGFL